MIDKLQTSLAQKESDAQNLQQKLNNLKQSRSNINSDSRLGNSSTNKDGYHISAEDEIKYLRHEVENYKKQVNCTNCQQNPKEMVLISCGHLFCTDCVEREIQQRRRKCPYCQKKYTNEEFKKVLMIWEWDYLVPYNPIFAILNKAFN